LAQVLRHLPIVTDPNVLVGTGTSDDAAVYRLSETQALVATVDFFTPVVDDPYDFGRITAANSLSDIYAMGGRPIYALNIVSFPRTSLPLEILEKILRGGADKLAEAGVPVVGGHSIDDPEPKYGLAVTGLVHPDKIIMNVGAKPGDRLYLTKPLGIGIITTGIKRDLVSKETIKKAVEVMATLNAGAGAAMTAVGVSAATDITGFGLMGHLREMTCGSGVRARLFLSAIPVLDEAWELARQGVVPGGARNNLTYLQDAVQWAEGIDETERLVLCDPQTSGGMLISIPAERADQLERALRDAGVPVIAGIGEIISEDEGGAIIVTRG